MKEVFSMGNLGKIFGVLLIVVALIVAGVGGFLMFSYAPAQAEEATFPTDFDEHNLYGGSLERLNTTSGQVENVDFTIDRRIQTKEELGGGKLLLEESILGIENGTKIEIDELCKNNTYQIDEKSILLYRFQDLKNEIVIEYTEDDESRVMPVPYVYRVPVCYRDFHAV